MRNRLRCILKKNATNSVVIYDHSESDAYSLNYSLNTTLENSLSQVEIDQLKEKKLLKDPLIAVKALLTLFKRGKWNSCRKDLNQLGLKLAQDEKYLLHQT